ncbi:MAG: hypothetical protein JWP52_3012, partial [Rhizobacter sp.]|nr:hypothetical protein [Rhizobacter sp.]
MEALLKHSSRLSLAAVAAALALAGCASPGYQGDPAYGPTSGVPHYGSAPAPAVPNYGGQPAPVASTQPGQMQYGVVRSIEPLRTEASTSGGGAAIGGLLGGVVGNQFGSGSGRAAGTIAGVLGGVLLGNQVEKNQ